MTQHNGVSRRGFLGAGLAAAATAAANVAQAAPRATEVDSWDEEFDMIVVGSGFAGLSACYEAQRLGLKKIWNWDVGAEFRISIKKPGLQGLRP